MNTELTLHGVIPPSVTPFDENGYLDRDGFRSEIQFLLDAGVHGVGVAGSTGEGPSLTPEELASLVESACELSGGRVPVIAGVMGESTRQAIQLAGVVRDAGADVLLVTPVRYSGATKQENLEFFRAIADAAGVPIVVYNVVPTNPIAPELAAALTEIPLLHGIKQVDLSEIGAMVASLGAKGSVFSACDSLLYSSYTAGARGCIAAIATVCPRLCVEQWKAWEAGDHGTAAEIQHRLLPVVRSYMARPFPAKVKYAIREQGRYAGFPRAPLRDPEPEEKEKIRSALAGAAR